jgi:hypothetical protein
MGANQTSWALVRPDGYVETFLRMDLPETWVPEEGYTVVPDDELPEGWQRPPEEITPVPVSVSARQIRLWLVQHGVPLASIDAAIEAIPDQATRDIVKVEWEWAPYVERSHPWLVPLASALGLDEAAVDQAFREAYTL